ncbi:MAG: SET domain-containing protein-lysine N-methyltransferase [Candidatus Omnitrophica bacterium CG12_big_fil_rev_8_21_14_0_65_45_16]|nr:MAG: SET domain-containing protein-lysine N-methyltransferase [Candidatus Omnitrophica bacterium CG12_big_fil_rev_8_21_14_0_65_45_16]
MKKYPKLEVRTSKIHRKGVFAVQPIKKNERIIEYTGKKMTAAQVDRSRSDYIFTLSKHVFIDGKNTARYINHSCAPNCEAEIKGGHIWINAIRDIKVGEELAYNYSFDLKESKDYPCGCRARRCAGFILDETLWPKLKKSEKRERQLAQEKFRSKLAVR